MSGSQLPKCPICHLPLRGTEEECPVCGQELTPVQVEEETNATAEPMDYPTPTRTSMPDIAGLTGESEDEDYGVEEIEEPKPVEVPEPIPTKLTPEELVKLGEEHAELGEYEDALANFDRAITRDQNLMVAWYNRGVVCQQLEDLDGARMSFEVALDLQPKHLPSLANLAVILSTQGLSEEASKHAEDAICQLPDASPARRALERLLVTEEEVEVEPDAPPSVTIEDTQPQEPIEEEVEQVPETSPPEPPIAEVAQPATIEADVTEPAPAVSQPTVEEPAIAEDSLDALSEKATGLVRTDEPAAALELLRPVLHEEAAGHAQCWAVAAGAMARLDLLDAAVEAYNHSLTINNEDAKSWYNLGIIHKRNQHPTATKTCHETALKLDPTYSRAAESLAQLNFESGDIEGYIKAMKALLKLDPLHPDRLEYCRILIAIAEGEEKVLENVDELPTTLPEGVELANDALALLPDEEDKEILLLKAKANSLIGEHIEAIRIWRYLLDQDMEDDDSWTGLALALEAAGELEKATKCHAKAAELRGETPHTTSLEITPPPISQPSEEEPEKGKADLSIAAREALEKVEGSESMETESHSVTNQEAEWYNKGLGLLTEQKFNEALSCFDKGLAQSGDCLELKVKNLNGRGNCLYFLDRYPEALDSYHQAQGMAPHLLSAETLYNMGTAHAAIERYDDGIRHFEAAIDKGLDSEAAKRAKEQIKRCRRLRKERARAASK